MASHDPTRPLHVALISRDRAFSGGTSMRDGFVAAGARCTIVPYEDWFPDLHSQRLRGSGVVSRLAGDVVRPLAEARLVATVARLRPDVVFFLKCDDLHAAVYGVLRRLLRGVPLVAYHPDDPFNVGRGPLRPGPAHRRARAQLLAADLVVSWSPEVVRRAEALGARRARYLPFAADPAVHPRVPVTDADRAALGADVTFVGNWDQERERWLTGIAAALEAEGVGLAVWGTEYWETRCKDARVRAAWRGRPLFGEEMSKAALASAINLNVLRLQNRGATNMRTFEIPCAGGFMLHERSPALSEWLPPGVACDDF
ncbi:MAG: hypothetical protein KC635_22030, partial [Myxococcales bacterium]|nr:hypothetical protein [Myxococcales bacterium]